MHIFYKYCLHHGWESYDSLKPKVASDVNCSMVIRQIFKSRQFWLRINVIRLIDDFSCQVDSSVSAYRTCKAYSEVEISKKDVSRDLCDQYKLHFHLLLLFILLSLFLSLSLSFSLFLFLSLPRSFLCTHRNGINKTNDSTNEERQCTMSHGIGKEMSICQFLLCLDLVRFPVPSHIKPQTPLLTTLFRLFLKVSVLRPNSPLTKTLFSQTTTTTTTSPSYLLPSPSLTPLPPPPPPPLTLSSFSPLSSPTFSKDRRGR